MSWAGVSLGFLESRRAAAPETKAVAWEVPDMDIYPPQGLPEMMFSPGAAISTSLPLKFENMDIFEFEPIEATEMTFLVR